MHIFLFVISLLAFFAGCSIFLAAKSAIHEIEAFLIFLISALLFTGAAIIEAILKSHTKANAPASGADLAVMNTAQKSSPPRERLSPAPEYLPPPIPHSGDARERVYYYSTGADTKGPCTDREVLQLLKTGSINYQTPVFKEGEAEWKRLAQFDEFFATAQRS
jgi:hypothetical protein